MIDINKKEYIQFFENLMYKVKLEGLIYKKKLDFNYR